MPAPHAVARPSGGFRPSLDSFNEEQEAAQALGGVANQKQLGQQAAQLPATAGKKPGSTGNSQPAAKPPRAMGSLTEELIKRPLTDIKDEILKFLDIPTLLGIRPQTDTPEEQAKKKQIHQRWQTMTQEQQQIAAQRYQAEMQKKQREEQEKQIKKQQEAQRQAAELAVPSTPAKGPMGPGSSHKSRTMTQLSQQRNTIDISNQSAN